jgi:hypothetical protein
MTVELKYVRNSASGPVTNSSLNTHQANTELEDGVTDHKIEEVTTKTLKSDAKTLVICRTKVFF